MDKKKYEMLEKVLYIRIIVPVVKKLTEKRQLNKRYMY